MLPTLLLLFAQLLAMVSAGYTSREGTISTATQSNLNNLFLNAYHRGLAMIDYSGTVADTPLATPYFNSYVNLTGDTQQAIYGTVKR